MMEAVSCWRNLSLAGFEKVSCLVESCLVEKATTQGPEANLGEAGVSIDVKLALNSLPRNRTWVAWMNPRNSSHQASKG